MALCRAARRADCGIAIAVGEPVVGVLRMAHEPTPAGEGAGARHGAGGVAGNRIGPRANGVVAYQTAGDDTWMRSRADGDRGIAGQNRAIVVAYQSARRGALLGDRNRTASGVAGCHRAVVYAYQSAICPVIGAPAPLHVGVDHSHATDNGCGADLAEQPGIRGVSIDGQVGDGLAVAVEHGGVSANRGPIGVRAGVAAVHGAVAIGVEVQVAAQFVPAARRRAAHAGDRAGEGRGVGGGVGGGAVAVQVVADGVELGEASDVDEVVVVVVVVDLQAAVREHRIAGCGRSSMRRRQRPPCRRRRCRRCSKRNRCRCSRWAIADRRCSGRRLPRWWSARSSADPNSSPRCAS